jgi:ribosomal protein S18 acetylase RimI-like enzyme
MGEYRNQGIGTKVLNTLVKEVGAYYLTPDNADATRLYERLGEKLEEDSKEYNDFGFAVDMGFGVYQIG